LFSDSSSQSKLPKGATVAPIIIATDKTQLTNFSEGKSAYPVYLTLGNIPKSIRRKPSKRACVLIAYLPVDSSAKLKGTTLKKKEVSICNQRIFHAAMWFVLGPLIKAGKTGVRMTGGNGEVRNVYPILACYVADFPEQCLVACTKYGTCPKCTSSAKKLQDPDPGPPRSRQWTLDVIENTKQTSNTKNQFYKKCMEQDVLGSVYDPFWKDFPLCDIHKAITPNILHQLYQGVLKHIITWCQTLMTPEELDAHLHILPPAFGVQHFKNEFSALSQISGPERKNMAKVLLGCLVGSLAKPGIKAVRGLLDFIHIAQYKSHDDITLGYLKDALDRFQENKDFFHKNQDTSRPQYSQVSLFTPLH